MVNVNVSLPEPLETFAAEQARQYGFADTGDYIRALVAAVRLQIDHDIEAKLLEGVDSEPLRATPQFWLGLREEAAQRLERAA